MYDYNIYICRYKVQCVLQKNEHEIFGTHDLEFNSGFCHWIKVVEIHII